MMRLCLFGGFILRQGEQHVILPPHVQRLIALVSLRTALTREQASGTLWPDVPDERAGARLRTALWRVQRCGHGVLHACNGQLFLAENVDVDIKNWTALALRVIDRPGSATALGLDALRPGGELLPGWYDDWVLAEQERARQLQLHVLETAADELLRSGRHACALELALGALQIDQTRESAHRLVIRVHLAEGNAGEARRQFARCCEILGELGLHPSEQMRALQGPAGRPAGVEVVVGRR
jgi:DNA-binding SARP family transcriptional activator